MTKKIINRESIWKAAPTKVSKTTKLSQKDGASARIQKEELEEKEIMSVGVPAGIITALLVLLAAFLAALYGKGNGVSAISAFCICNPCLHCTCTCASLMPFHRHAAIELQSRKMTSLPMATCPSEATGQKNVQNQRGTTQSG